MRKRTFFAEMVCFCLCVFSSVNSQEEPKLFLASEVDVSQEFIKQVRKEKDFIRMATYRLSDFGVVQALLEAHKRGVIVEVFVDPVSITKNTPLALLSKEGVSVLVWQGPFQKKKGESNGMRHAFCVFGSDLSWTGSYVFSVKRFSNSRSSALLVQDASIAKKYLKEFESLKKKGVFLADYLEKKL